MHLAKKAIFQDLPLMPQRAGEERWRWLYGQLRAAILDHRLPPGARVPSSRSLAKQHGVSSGTVVGAVDPLRSEGYLETRVGAGAFVATATPDEAIAVTNRKVGGARKQTTRTSLSKRGDRCEVGTAPRIWGQACLRNTGQSVPLGNCDVVGAALVTAELGGDGRLGGHRGRLRLRVPLFWTTAGGASKPGPRRVRDLCRHLHQDAF